MLIFRSNKLSASISLMLTVVVLFGGSLAPHLHGFSHQERGEGTHCSHDEHGPAFELHHSTLHGSECVFQQRTPDRVSASKTMEVIPQWNSPIRLHQTRDIPAQQAVRAHLCRGPPLA